MSVLPEKYQGMPEGEIESAIWQAKQRLGRELTILGHHYQSDQVIQFADFRGDSLDLSRRAAEAREARYIVFCGVHFMAESAAILCQPEQRVIQPVIEAYCPMAHMASVEDTAAAWAALNALWPNDLMPITYQNSTAAVKAWVGQRGGAVCTSANAETLLAWGWKHKGHILFLPDEHLGTNTALAMGVPSEQVGIWDPLNPHDPQTLSDCRIVVWKGFCNVHTCFTPDDVTAARQRYPGCRVIVHPECTHQVVALSDAAGSTTGIIHYVEQAPVGSTIIVGTEWHMVNRLSQQFTDRVVAPLKRSACKQMSMTTMPHLLYVLDQILQGNPQNVVTVETGTAHWARAALERMLKAN